MRHATLGPVDMLKEGDQTSWVWVKNRGEEVCVSNDSLIDDEPAAPAPVPPAPIVEPAPVVEAPVEVEPVIEAEVIEPEPPVETVTHAPAHKKSAKKHK